MSARTLRITLIVLATIGMGWAAYLSYVHYSGSTPLCSLKGDPCAAVQKSRYSELLGVPVALIGAIGYLVILGSLLASDGERARFATAALALGGFGFSAYLTYREVFTLNKICEDCVASAAIMTVLMCLSVWRFLRGDGGELLPDGLHAGQAGGAAVDSATPLGSAS
ncbi:MAG TPA: vitamin K epoxide reductase family protein [Solirubrobacteraceae bacterium]|nr:vitamin K epoxide reductase family protein [Solirubrobacteraceae bacterium]